MLSFLYDSSWIGSLLGAGGATPADLLYDSCYAGDMHAAVACLEKGASAVPQWARLSIHKLVAFLGIAQ